VVDGTADHGIDILALQELAKVGVAFGVGEYLPGARYVAGIYITDGDDITVSGRISRVACSLSATADKGKIDLLTGRQGIRASPRLPCGAFV